MKKITVNSHRTKRTLTPVKVKAKRSWRKNNGRPVIASLEEAYRQESLDSNHNGFNGLKEEDYNV